MLPGLARGVGRRPQTSSAVLSPMMEGSARTVESYVLTRLTPRVHEKREYQVPEMACEPRLIQTRKPLFKLQPICRLSSACNQPNR